MDPDADTTYLDELVDLHWPRRGPCLICGVRGEDARHRVMDSVAENVRAGDHPEAVADTYGVSLTAVAVAVLAAIVQDPTPTEESHA
jgi:hypothetical protein